MKLENYVVATLDSGLLLTLKEDKISVQRESMSIFGNSERICLTISELQDIINVVNGKRMEQEVLMPRAKRRKREESPKQLKFDSMKKAKKWLDDTLKIYGDEDAQHSN